jgi:hypothetical protein
VSGVFSVLADGNHVAGSTPGKAGIWTTAAGAVSATQRIHVDASGKIGIAKLSALTEILDIVGNIAVSGTVDGRDIATDGSKLNGIEAGADVTDFTNVALALAAATGVIDINGQDLDDVGNAAIKIFCPHATPTAENFGDLWYETDTRILWFWMENGGGTGVHKWASCQIFHKDQAFEGVTVTTSGERFTLNTDPSVEYDAYILGFTMTSYVATTNDGTRYWTPQLYYDADGGSSYIATLSTVSNTPDQFEYEKTAVNVFIDMSSEQYVWRVVATREGTTPGTFYAGISVTWRLIHL